ncbi:MAG: hypothetical protein Aurels2KO_52080 [Aureliella sp.]
MTEFDYMAIAERYCRFLEAAKITGDEYAENLLTSCVTYPEVDEKTARRIAGTIPDSVRERVEHEISKVLDASYRFPTLHYGGPGPSAEVREETRQLYEARIRVCANLLEKTLNTR